MTEAAAGPNGSPGTTRVSIASGPLVGPVLRRVVGMLAARADLPLDRLDDAVLVADLIASRAPAHMQTASVDVGNVIEQLADDISVKPDGDAEYLMVRLAYSS